MVAVLFGLAGIGAFTVGKRLWNAGSWCCKRNVLTPWGANTNRNIATQSQCTYTRKDTQPRFKPLPVDLTGTFDHTQTQ